MAETSKHRTPKNKRRRKVKNTFIPTPLKFEDLIDEYSDSDSSTGTPTTPNMAERGNEPTNKEMFDLLMEVKKSQDFLSDKFDSFKETMAQLTIDTAKAKKDIVELKEVDRVQQQQIDVLATHIEELDQRAINNDLVITGLPNLQNLTIETILTTISSVYGLPMQQIIRCEAVTGNNKTNNKPFQMLFMTTLANSVKLFILGKQKELGQICWGQLMADMPENLKLNKLLIKPRLTRRKQTLLNDCKNFSKLYQVQIPFTWASKLNGKILMKELGVEKPTVINSHKDLEVIKRKYMGVD
jgi:hypothetical protein